MTTPPLDVSGWAITSRKKGSPCPCTECGDAKNDGRALCGKCALRKYRSDPVKAERGRERSRRWKANNSGKELAAMADRQGLTS